MYGTQWSALDWTVAVVIICIILVCLGIGLLFCCLLGGDKESDEKDALDAVVKEREKLNKELKSSGEDRAEGISKGEPSNQDDKNTDKKE